MYPVEGERSIDIAAPPERVWALVTDIGRMGEWSPNTIHAEWADAARQEGPAVGRRFRGTNRLPIVRQWTSTATVTAFEPGRRFAFAVGKNPDDPNTLWSYDLAPSRAGTRVTERWQMLREPAIVLLYYRLIGQRDRLAEGVEETLRRLKAAAESQSS
jgi:uncharacterized protein YndB with AHSA1/START domain